MKNIIYLFLVCSFQITSITTNARASSEEVLCAQSISAYDMAAFSRVIAENPLGRPFPYNVRAVVYSNPNDCFESVLCENSWLFLTIIGDGELPDYKVYEVGNAVNWEFVSWDYIPTQFFDDERDSFVVELIKEVPCKVDNCNGAATRKEHAKGRVSLFGFEWVE